jgi:N,N'-diacetylchitobiose transport system substrate-binding protein
MNRSTRTARTGAVAATVLAATALAAAVALAACSGADEDPEPRNLTVWIMDPGAGEAEQAVDEAVRAFESRHDDVRVRVDYVPWAQAHDRLTVAAGGGAAPDLAELSTGWIPELAATGALDPVEPADGHVAALVEGATVDGVTYGYPWYGGARALVYRTDILDLAGVEPPGTWEELLAVGERIATADADVAPIHVAGEYSHWFIPLIWAAGGEIAVAADGGWRPGVDTAAGRAAVAHYQQLWQAGWTPDDGLDWTSIDVRQAFADGRSAMMIAASWDLAAVLDRTPDLADRVGVSLLPAGPGGSRDAFAGGSHLGVFEQSPHRDLAHEFAQLLISAEHAPGFAGAIGFLPGTADGVRAAVGDDDLYAPFGTQLVDHARSYPPAAWWSRVESDRVFVEEMRRLLDGEQGIDETVSAIDQALRAAATG